MRTHIAPPIVAAALAITGGVAAAAFGMATGHDGRATARDPARSAQRGGVLSIAHLSQVTFSNRGSQLRLTARMRRDLRAPAGLGGSVTALQTISARTFYRLDGTGRGTCYGVGDTGGSFGFISCPTGAFPTVTHPLLDFSIVDISSTTRQVHLYRLEGIAADQVASVAVLDASGNVLTSTPVTNNVYHLDSMPTESVSGLEALNGGGHTVQVIPFSG